MANSYHAKIIDILKQGKSMAPDAVRRALLKQGIDIGQDYANFLLAEMVHDKKIIRSKVSTGWLYSIVS